LKYFVQNTEIEAAYEIVCESLSVAKMTNVPMSLKPLALNVAAALIRLSTVMILIWYEEWEVLHDGRPPAPSALVRDNQ
jgi:hypothetical protein